MWELKIKSESIRQHRGLRSKTNDMVVEGKAAVGKPRRSEVFKGQKDS